MIRLCELPLLPEQLVSLVVMSKDPHKACSMLTGLCYKDIPQMIMGEYLSDPLVVFGDCVVMKIKRTAVVEKCWELNGWKLAQNGLGVIQNGVWSWEGLEAND